MAKIAGHTGSKQTLIIPVQLADLANSQVFKLPVPYAFTLNSIKLRIGKAATTASKLATITAQIAGVACTGGVISATSAAATPAGVTVDGTAITALNVGNAGDTVEAAISSVTAFVEGDGWLEFNVTPNL